MTRSYQEEKMNKEKNPNRLPVGKFFAWKSRDISTGSNAIVMGYLMIFCTNTLGMPAGLVGTLLAASKIFDGISDLFAGYIIDNTHTRWGKARPYELSILGVWLCTLLMFFCPPEASMIIKAIWIFVMYTFVQSVFLTLLGAAQTPYMIRAFGSRMMITKVSSYGGIVSTVGSAVVSITFPILMGKLATSAAGWRTILMIYAVPLAFVGILRFVFVKENPEFDNNQSQERIKFSEVLDMLKKNKYAWVLAGVMGAYNIIIGMNVATYYFTWIVGDIGKYSILQMLTLPFLIVMFIFPKIMRKMSVTGLIILGAALGATGYIVNFFAGANMGILIVGFVGTSLSMLPISYLQALLIMDVSTYNEYKGMRRMEGTCGAVAGFAAKVCNGLGAALVGFILGAAGYIGTAAEQSENALTAIRLSFSVIPALLWVVVIIFTKKFGKLSKKIAEYEVEIKTRKESVVVES